MEAIYLSSFGEIRKEIGLPNRDLKMLFSGFPLTCASRGESRDSLCIAWDRPNHYCSSVDQLASERVKLSCFRLLSEHEKALDHQREHPPATSDIFAADDGQRCAMLFKQCQCAGAIAGVCHLPEK